MKQKKFNFILILSLVLLMIAMGSGCSKSSDASSKNEILDEGQYLIYYINNTENGLVSQIYSAAESGTEELIDELLGQLATEPTQYSSKKVINEDVIVKEYTLEEDVLTINFDTTYENLPTVLEVLTRASIVKTLCQIEGIDYIVFNVGGQPLIDQYDKPVGNMTAEDFIDGTDVDDNMIPVTLTLYFSNESGDALVTVTRPVTYDGTITQEQLVLQQLIQGPEAGEDDVLATVPEDTIVNSVTTKDGICYVDFSSDFLNKSSDITDEVAIYSVVNSLVELSTINKVQFSIDGKTQETYRENIEFDILFERKLQLIEGSN